MRLFTIITAVPGIVVYKFVMKRVRNVEEVIREVMEPLVIILIRGAAEVATSGRACECRRFGLLFIELIDVGWRM